MCPSIHELACQGVQGVSIQGGRGWGAQWGVEGSQSPVLHQVLCQAMENDSDQTSPELMVLEPMNTHTQVNKKGN